MTIALEHTQTAPRAMALSSTTTSLLGVAGLTSLGAGAIHAAAIGVHSEHRSAVVTFTAVAALQLAWGVIALLRGNRLIAVLGMLLGVGALAGWATAKISGIGLIAGLEEAESIQTADGLAAGLAAASVLLAGAALWTTRGERRGVSAPVPLLAVAVSALTVFGMVSAGSHAHAAGGHGGEAVSAAGAPDHHGAGATATDVDGHPARRVVGLTSPEGTCGRGERLPDAAMLHVWIVDHPCGPFSSLEGVGAGQAIDEAQDPNADPACQHSAH